MKLVIFLVSGGGSSLIALPDKITLDDKIHVTDLLLKSGATIQEFNCIRKHLSKIKGGKLVENLNCNGVSLIMSDVEGDDLSSIASGTTYIDNTTFEDALNIIKKYRLRKKISLEVLEVLEQGSKQQIVEELKFPKIKNYVIANNLECINAMKKRAKNFGYSVVTMQVFGDIKEAVIKIIEKISENQKNLFNFWWRNNCKGTW